jgi:hypothetical protein
MVSRSTLLGTVALAAFSTIVVGLLGVLTFCGTKALTVSTFLSDGQCSASDTPYEVFESFVVIGMIFGVVVSAIFLMLRIATSSR